MSTKDATRLGRQRRQPTGAERDRDSLDHLAPLLAERGVTLHAVLGDGGFGRVFAATHPAHGDCAVKIVHADIVVSAEIAARFEREVRMVQRVRHRGLPLVHDLGTVDGDRPYSIMERLDGEDLARRLDRDGRLPVDEALWVAGELCDVLATVHDAGVVHRDVKAANVLVTEDGARVVLVDFGIAKLIAPEAGDVSLTTSRHRLGTPAFMSPEQIARGEVGPRTDLYATGALLYHLLTGRPPFDSVDEALVAEQHLHAARPVPSESAPVPAAVDALVATAMAIAAERRYPDARAMRRAIDDALAALA